MTITQSELKHALLYNEETGDLTWKIAKTRVVIGQVAGFINSGYVRVKLNQQTYPAHRLIWLYVHGVWPKQFIDHRNHVRSDNRLSNLREASPAQNMHNRIGFNRTGFKGIRKRPYGNRWQAQGTRNNTVYPLGTYSTPEEAHAAYAAFAIKHHGEFHNLTNSMEYHIMARNVKSAVLSKEDTKAAVIATKAEIKGAKDNIKQIAGIRKEADKAFATANKAHLLALKGFDKDAATAAKTLVALELKLGVLAPAKVPV